MGPGLAALLWAYVMGPGLASLAVGLCDGARSSKPCCGLM